MSLENKQPNSISFQEFTALMILLMSLTALSIDAILPALGHMGNDLEINNNQAQYVISFLFLGLTLGQIIYGPLSDSYGRKTMIYLGLAIFSIGSILSMAAVNLEFMLIGRTLQGLGAASARVVTIAMVRDKYKGRDMARVMSIIMGAFIIVPALAPSLGQFAIWVSNWRAIFALFLCIAFVGSIWMHKRLPETLSNENRHPFNSGELSRTLLQVIKDRTTLGYTICAGFVFGGFIGYLTSSQQIFQDYYNTGDKFAFYFATLALAIGLASIFNSRIVKKYGMRLITKNAFISMICLSAVFCMICVIIKHPPLPIFMTYALMIFFSMGLLFGNINAIAMEPMGHMAGIASAVIGTVSSVIALIIGSIIGLSFNMTLFPLSLGFLITSLCGFLMQYYLEKTNKRD